MTEMPGSCPICKERLSNADRIAQDVVRLDCPRCGTFLATEEAIEDIVDDKAHLLRRDADLVARIGYHLHLIRRGADNHPLLKTEDIDRIARNSYAPTLSEQADNLVRLIGARSRVPGISIQISAHEDQFIIGALKPDTVSFLVKELQEAGFLYGESFHALGGAEQFSAELCLTLAGWQRHDEIVRAGGVGKRVFMAMPFNKPDLDAEWLPAVRDAVGRTGFTLRRVDDELRPGIIDVRMRQEIKDARFVIVELTHANLGAYWEAGFAEGLGKPVIYTCRKGETNIHFDTAHLQRIEWQPEHIDRAAQQLTAMIRLSVPEAKQG